MHAMSSKGMKIEINKTRHNNSKQATLFQILRCFHQVARYSLLRGGSHTHSLQVPYEEGFVFRAVGAELGVAAS